MTDAGQDAGVGADASADDASVEDAGSEDASRADAATVDASAMDATFGDANVADAQNGDAGELDLSLASDANYCAFADALDRSCSVDTDCVPRIHQINCCGTMSAIAVNVSEASTYAERESLCEASYPRCRCAALPTQTDSGEVVESEGDVQAACVGRGPTMVCLSYITERPADGV